MVYWNETGDILCQICIDIMKHMTHLYGISYGLINVLLFIILGPLSTCVFMISSFLAKRGDKTSRKISVILDVIGVIIILLVLIPIFHAVITFPTKLFH